MKNMIALMVCLLLAGCMSVPPEYLDDKPPGIEEGPAVAWFVC